VPGAGPSGCRRGAAAPWPDPAAAAAPGPACRSFLRDGVAAPLGLGDVLLEDQSVVKGFIGEGYGVVGCEEITHHGGWRHWLAHLEAAKTNGCA